METESDLLQLKEVSSHADSSKERDIKEASLSTVAWTYGEEMDDRTTNKSELIDRQNEASKSVKIEAFDYGTFNSDEPNGFEPGPSSPLVQTDNDPLEVKQEAFIDRSSHGKLDNENSDLKKISEIENNLHQLKEGPTKRCRNVDDWERNKSKKLRNEGKEYRSLGASKKIVPARVVGPPCNDGCFERLGEGNINEIFNNYWQLSDYNVQTSYLQNCIRSVDIKRKRTGAIISRRKHSFMYQVPAQNTFVIVCASAFQSLHGITNHRVRSAFNKISPTGNPILDKRGGNPTPRAVSFERRQIVIEHINKFPTIESHYSRINNPGRKYLSADLNICKLYELYKEWRTFEYPDVECVSDHYYRDTFREYFNLSFGVPTSDSCRECAEYKIKVLDLTLDENAKKESELKNKIHREQADCGQELVRFYSSNKDNNMAVIAVDMQHALPTPKLSVGIIFYKRQLWTYNVGIHNCKNGDAHMYVWNETIARRGCNEITSCLKHYVDNIMSKDVDTLVVFSYNSAGLNKNINIILYYLSLVHKERLKTVLHIKLISGHSCLPCDRDFGLIKRKGRLNSRVFTPKDWCKIIKESRKKHPFQVIEVDSSIFLNFDVLKNEITIPDDKGDNATKVSESRYYKISSNYKMGYKISPNYHRIAEGLLETGLDNFEIRVPLQKGKSRNYNRAQFDLSKVVLPLRYEGSVPINPTKVQDLRELLKYLPPDDAFFFENIIAQNDATTDCAPNNNDEDDNTINYCE